MNTLPKIDCHNHILPAELPNLTKKYKLNSKNRNY